MQYDPIKKGLLITRTRNCDGVLDANTWAYNESAETWRGQANDLWHVASVPEETVWTWMLEFNAVRPISERIKSPFEKNKDWESFQWLRLNSSDYRKLRTAPVIV